MHTTYRAGQWYVIVLPGALVALPPETPADVVGRLWERMPQQRSLATVVDVLTAHAGGVFASLPSFVAAVVEDAGIRIALRGDVQARVRTASGWHDFSGADVTTWSERFVGDASHLEVTVGTGAGEHALPLHTGVVRAATVVAEIEPGDGIPTPVRDAVSVEEPAQAPVEIPPAPVEIPPMSVEQADPTSAPALDTPSEVTLAPTTEDFDQLWGATVHSAPKAEPAVDPAPDVPVVPIAQGDHDGATISAVELRALRQQAPASDDVATAVLPVATAAPVATGRIRVSTGQVVALDRTVIIGRRPRSTRASGANLPHLIAVESPQQDISRGHLEIRPEGDTVVVIDLHTTNGSTLLRPDVDPMRLHPGEQTLVVSGDVVDLGDGVVVTFEDLP